MTDSKGTPSNKGAILIVAGPATADEPFVAELRSGGYEVAICESANHVTNLVDNKPRGWQPTLFIVDLIVPGSSGFEIVRRLSDRFDAKRVPVAMMAGSPTMEDTLESSSAGAISIFKKPVTVQNIAEAVAKYRARAAR